MMQPNYNHQNKLPENKSRLSNLWRNIAKLSRKLILVFGGIVLLCGHMILLFWSKLLRATAIPFFMTIFPPRST